MTYHAFPRHPSWSWSPLSSTLTLCWLLPWRAFRLGRLCTSALSSHTPPLSLSRAPATALVLTSAFLLFLQRHQRHLPRALSHTTALLRNLQQECPTTRHGSGFSAQSFMVWPHPALQIICSPLPCSNSPPRIHCPTSYSEIVPSRGAYGHSYPEPSSFLLFCYPSATQELTLIKHMCDSMTLDLMALHIDSDPTQSIT